MSWKATGYVKDLKRTPTGRALTRTEKFVLLMLAEAHNDETGEARVSLNKLAANCLISKSYLIRVLETLRADAALVVAHDEDPRYGHVMNGYYIVGTPARPGPTRRPASDASGLGASDVASLGGGDATGPGASDAGGPPLVHSDVTTPSDIGASPSSESSSPEKTDKTGKEPGALVAGAFGIADVLARWRAIEGVKQPDELTGDVLKRVVTRLKEHPQPAWWASLFEKIAASDFLCGRSTDFAVDLYWALGPQNMAKIRAGNYANRTGPPILCVNTVKQEGSYTYRPCSRPVSPAQATKKQPFCEACIAFNARIREQHLGKSA